MARNGQSPPPEHFDVLIVGAGISGVGGAYHLTKQCPGTSFVVLEAQESFGGTWLTHRYPGIRSDSDLYTFGYRFKPWTGAPIATAAEILRLHGRGDRRERPRPATSAIATGSPSARWSSEDNRWTHRGHAHRHRRDASASPRTSSGCARATTGTRRATRPSGRAWTTSRAGSSIRRPGRRTSTTRARRSSSSARAPRRRRSSRRSPTTAPTSRCCSARRPISSPAATPTTSPTSCAQLQIDESVDPRDRAPQDPATIRPSSRAAAFEEPEVVKQELLGGVRAYLGPDYDMDTHFTPTLPALAAAHRLRSRRRPVQGHPRRQGLGRHRRDRALHRERHPAEVRQGARGRHHRHRHRLQSQRARRHRLHHRRQAARLRRHRHLSRHDVHRRAQHGLGVRLLPRELDACAPTWSPTSSAACSST